MAALLIDQWPGEGVADDEERRDLFALAGVEDVGRVQSIGDRLDHDGAAGQPAAQGVPVGGAVHEGRGGQRPERARRRRLDDLVEPFVVGPVGPTDAERGDEEVGLAPQDALGGARGAAGVDDVEVVGTPLDRGPHGVRRGEGLLVVEGAREQVVAAPVVDAQQEAGASGERRQDLGQRRGEAAVVDDRRRVGVVEQVAQLVGDVAVVHVEGGGARLGGPQHALEVGVRVRQVQGDVIVGRRPRIAVREPSPPADAVGAEEVRDASGPVGDLGPGPGPPPPEEAGAVRDLGGDRLVQRRQVELQRVSRPRR